MILENCFQDWVEWKTQDTMASVDKQTEEIKKSWEAQEDEQTLRAAQQEFPDAKVSIVEVPVSGNTPVDNQREGAKLKGVLIEHPPDESKAQSILGGPMEIRAPWTFAPGSNGYEELKERADEGKD